MRCSPQDPDYQYLKSYYGLSDEFDSHQLVCQDASMNKITFISKQLSDYLFTDSMCHKLAILNMGVPLFSRNNSRFSGSECIFRINQEGVSNLIPFMNKRIVKTKCLPIFKRFISKRYNGSKSDVQEDPVLGKAIDDLTPGCFVFVYELPSGKMEALSMHKFEYAVSSMINREIAYSF